ncbi:hypothetical protein [Acinetobacter sp. ANC 4805]|uniref:hypothetical protein n=1 Tax=Acinetobacter sp. ANC 4805 TaxID=2923425 RepID=UPI001F4AA23A|nr:hypothetical protein [Acinetobacter sp. ANC 4805]MCH7310567.1 hypothetical protein [Acinetobacter sp. ANC 4805]
MSSNREKIKKLFDYVMRLVVMYSFVREKIKHECSDDCEFFQEVDRIIVERTNKYYLSNIEEKANDWVKSGYINEYEKEQKIQECINKFRQYYWNYYQFNFLPNDGLFFEELKIKPELIGHQFKDIHRILVNQFGEIELGRRSAFRRSYNIYSLIFENNFDEIFFKYHQLDQALKNPPKEFNFLNEFIGLIELLPYYSPYFIPSITELESYKNSVQEKRHFSARYSPVVKGQTYETAYLDLNHKPIALIDSILQFIFQHTQHLIKWHYFGENIDHEMNDEERQQRIRLRENEDCEQLEQIAKILEAMFSALPRNQKLVYSFAKKKNSTKSAMTSLMFHNFKLNFDNHSMTAEDETSKKIKSSDASAHDLYVDFFKYLEREFCRRGLPVGTNKEGKIDTFKMVFKRSDEVLINGASFRVNYINHMKKFIVSE